MAHLAGYSGDFGRLKCSHSHTIVQIVLFFHSSVFIFSMPSKVMIIAQQFMFLGMEMF